VYILKCTATGDFYGTPTVNMNLPLQSLFLYTTFKSGIAAAGEPSPSE
jgi:hypothetical protein